MPVPLRDETLLRPAQVGQLWGLSAKTINEWRRIGDPRLPPPVVQSHRLTLYRRTDVLAYRDRWIESQTRPEATGA